MAEYTVTLPCLVGDEVWGIRIFGGKPHIHRGKVKEMYFSDDMRLCIATKNAGRGEWGKIIFPSYEAAVAAVEAQKGGAGNG